MAEMTVDDHIRSVDRAVEAIAHVRRMAEQSDLNMEEFDRKLDALCTEKHRKFAEMDDFALAIYGLDVVLKAGMGRQLFEDLFRGDDNE